LGGFACDRAHFFRLEPEDRGHRSLPNRDRLLHSTAANPHEFRGIRQCEGAGSGQRRILAERVAGDETRIAREIDAGFGFQNAHGGDGNGKKSRLRVLRECEAVGWSIPHDGTQLLAERGIDFIEYGPRNGEALRKRLTHADRLAALAGECECDGHAASSN
jgi:hypothetical protein